MIFPKNSECLNFDIQGRYLLDFADAAGDKPDVSLLNTPYNPVRLRALASLGFDYGRVGSSITVRPCRLWGSTPSPSRRTSASTKGVFCCGNRFQVRRISIFGNSPWRDIAERAEHRRPLLYR